MTCSACGKEGLTARTAVASGMVPDIERLYCKCAAPASCSEVVERLPAKEFLKLKRDQWTDLTGYRFAGKPTIDDQACEFAEAYATAILHSWRERRVQELLELLRGLAVVNEIVRADGGLDEQVWCKLCNVREKYIELADIIHKPECVLSAEWREHIRKGAKHE